MTTLESINKRWQESKDSGLGKSSGKLKEIPINKIEVIPEVFQPRFVRNDSQGIQSKEHVFDLSKRLEREGSLDPLLVLPVGDKVIIIDGHHRLEAYRKAKAVKVNAFIFNGDAFAAKLESAKENQKARLQMSTQERQQSAWNLVKEGREAPPSTLWIFRENHIINATGTSSKSIKSMRRIFDNLQKEGADIPDTWIAARTGESENNERDWDAEFAEQVEKYRQALLKAVPKLSTSRKRQAFALAVVSFSPQSTQEILRFILGTDECEETMEFIKMETEELEDNEF